VLPSSSTTDLAADRAVGPSSESELVNVWWRPLVQHAASIGAAALVLVAFFLPWMSGEGPFGLRSFTGADFARLIRNFEITVDSTQSGAQVRGAAIAIYLVPALAVNGAAIHTLSAALTLPRALTAWALAAGALFPMVILALLTFLSLVPVNDFAGVVGAPAAGYWLTWAGAIVLGLCARSVLRGGPSNGPPVT
jgi:hypothetical protein